MNDSQARNLINLVAFEMDFNDEEKYNNFLNSRVEIYCYARQYTYSVMRKYNMYYKKIGSYFNNRDHSTVYAALNQHNNDISNNYKYQQMVEKLDQSVLIQSLIKEIKWNLKYKHQK